MGPRVFLAAALWSMSTPASAQEVCGNRVDDDVDGLLDCFDPDCSGSLPDGDGDGLSDACDVCPGPSDGLQPFGPWSR